MLTETESYQEFPLKLYEQAVMQNFLYFSSQSQLNSISFFIILSQNVFSCHVNLVLTDSSSFAYTFT
jgi:hypothetical protein